MTVLMWVPLPPPFAGPEVASQQLVRAVTALCPAILVESATLRSTNATKGRLDLAGLRAFARAYRRFLVMLRGVDTVYLVAAANRVGCARDAVLIASARALGKRVVLHFRGGRYHELYAESGAVERAVLRRAWGAAAYAIVQTPRLRSQLADAAPHVPTSVIPNGLAGADHPAKASYPSGGPHLLFVGHLAFAKGFLTLIRAFRKLRETYPDARLVCAGELADSAEAFAAFLPADQRARYLAERHEIADEIRAALQAPGIEYAGVVTGARKAALFRDADLFVLPSYTEGFSLALLEAMFHGLAVVATRVGGTPDVIADTEQGLLVEPGDEDALVGALMRLAENPTLREQMGRRNAKVARERYELADVARSVVDLFEALPSTNTTRFAASASGSNGANRA
jgi:glycosyltransferase involved in cell wall biosynthesis